MAQSSKEGVKVCLGRMTRAGHGGVAGDSKEETDRISSVPFQSS